MPGEHLSFVADPALVTKVREIARADGTTASQAAARATALGAMLTASARRTLQTILRDGNEEVRHTLVALLARAVAQAGNMMVEQQLLASARERGVQAGPEDDEALALEAVRAVEEHRNVQRAARSTGPGSPAVGR